MYQKPVVLSLEDVAEGVFMASGAADIDNGLKCDSVYMRGVYQHQDTSSWWENGVETPRGYKANFGCLGCPAYTEYGCGLETHYTDSGEAASYDTDNGSRMPTWEAKGYGPDDIVTDWSVG